MERFIFIWTSSTAFLLKSMERERNRCWAKSLIARAQANSEAAKGVYVAGSQPSSDEQLFVAGYTY